MVGSGKGGADKKGRREDGCNDDENQTDNSMEERNKALVQNAVCVRGLPFCLRAVEADGYS